MTIQEAIRAAEAQRPGAVSGEMKLQWLRWLDGELRRSVVQLHQPPQDPAWAARGADLASPATAETELLATGPDEVLYLYWLMAQTDLAEGELTRYANDMQLYNAALAEFTAHYKAAHRPLARGQFCY